MALASAPTAPRFEHRTDAGPVLGLGASTPRLSWTVEQADPGWEQTAYEIEVVRNGTPQVFRVQGREQVLVPWPAPPLALPASAPRSACGSPTGRLEPVG